MAETSVIYDQLNRPCVMSGTLKTSLALADFLEYISRLVRDGVIHRVSMEAPLVEGNDVQTRVSVIFKSSYVPLMPKSVEDSDWEVDTTEFEKTD